MHFWIDKRSQVCSLNRNRYAPTANRHRGGGWSGAAGVAGCKVGGLVMVTPVHRFQPIESVQAAGAGLRRAHHHRPRLHNHGHHNNHHHHHLHQASSLLQASSSHASPNHHASSSRFSSAEPSLEITAQDMSENSELVGSARGGGGMSLLPHGAVGQGLASQQQVLLRLPAPQREVFASGRLKCGLWATLALISFSVAAARFYSDQKVRMILNEKGSGLEILYLMVCALLVLLLCCGCVISLCSAGPPRGCFIARTPQGPNNSQDLGPRSALIEVPEEEPGGGGGVVESQQPGMCVRHQLEQSLQMSERTIFEAQPSVIGGEPPPYHIAIWLPQPEATAEDPPPTTIQEIPPPSYDKATS
ncbi:uncharacterized protein LOC135943379 isoform X1 [Cloeon dipterum]|uniref:uncharacterized protein LOC135943379 isoform X1 n=1 Tax=Cloeon dipterum TaxID=197152 RepID=UPI0032202AFC